MIQGISVKEHVEFVCEHDTAEPKTVFVLKPLSGLDLLGMVNQEGDVKLSPAYASKVIEASVVDVKNYEGFTDTKALVKELDVKTLVALVGRITKLNNLTKEQVKN